MELHQQIIEKIHDDTQIHISKNGVGESRPTPFFCYTIKKI
jgi:hypothetical protein